MMRVDSERRLKNARSHTAGHLLDTAIRLCGIDIVPGKGYHFPDGPYVEYIGELEPMKKEALIPELQTEINRLIASSLKLSAKLINKESLPDFCSFVPPNIPNDQQVRVVFINDQDGCPCGGTHVENTADLKEVLIRKISSKKGVTRVSYSTI
jgi:Ser-tRNA(Ala) deacylase AlaX